jgi:MEDS: MEthanogen/methylotroph, DcmR Sensory domain
MVAVSAQHTKWLRDAVDGQAADVEFVDIEELGRNPAQIIPAWQQFLNTRSGRFRPVRGIGEPIWPGRRSEELVECQLHEAMLNIAIDPDTPFWLICSYDAVTLSPAVVEEAHRSHPVIVDAGSYHGSAYYTGPAHVNEMFAAELSELVGQPIAAMFTAHNVSRLYTYIKLELYVADLPAGVAGDLATATQHLVLNSLQRGAAQVTVQMWSQPHALICELVDDTVIDDVLLGRRVPVDDKHDGLWRANQLCDLVQMRSSSAGTTVRLHAWK